MGTTDERLAHFGTSHPLALLARGRCREIHGPRRDAACGLCWERVIRDDERVVVEFGLSRELVRDPLLVDELAVELACRGERVRLTPMERRAAVARLAGRGMSRTRIAVLLRMGGAMANRLYDAAVAGGSAA